MAILNFKETTVKFDSWFRKGINVIRTRHVDAVSKPSRDVNVAAEEEKSEVCFERRLGDTELSYYLPSREDGVNDMSVFLYFVKI